MGIDAINVNKSAKINAANAAASGNVTFKTNPYPNDSVEINEKEKKKELSSTKKVFATIGGILGGIILAGLYVQKRQASKLTKLYNEKMVFAELPEKLEFKEAKTVEEGIKFAKEVLKISEVDKEITLDAINYANRGLVDVANANKGKLFMPKKLRYDDFEDEMAHVIRDINSPNFGELGINRQYFNDDFLLQKLKEYFPNSGKPTKAVKKPKKNTSPDSEIFFTACYDSKIYDLITKFKKNPKSLSIAEKREVYYNVVGANNFASSLLSGAPLTTLKNNKKLWENFGINVDYEAFEKLTNKKQSETLREYFHEAKAKNGGCLDLNVPLYNPLQTIYHEMGHLQDFAANLKRLDVKKWKMPSFKDFYNDAKNNTNYTSAKVDHVNNRWGGLTYNGYEDLFKNNPEKFKERYPDLYEFLINQEYQQTAGKISWYAQTSIGEFIAETYAKMIGREKIPQDVAKLYEKYNGPKLP